MLPGGMGDKIKPSFYNATNSHSLFIWLRLWWLRMLPGGMGDQIKPSSDNATNSRSLQRWLQWLGQCLWWLKIKDVMWKEPSIFQRHNKFSCYSSLTNRPEVDHQLRRWLWWLKLLPASMGHKINHLLTAQQILMIWQLMVFSVWPTDQKWAIN